MPFNVAAVQPAMPAPTVWLALIQGVISFVSPCVLPLLPVYFAALLGSNDQRRGKTLVMRMLGFALGFMAFYLVLGAGAGALGSLMSRIPRKAVNIFTGALFILFGVMALEVFPWLHLPGSRADASRYASGGFLSMLMFGAVLALSWAPCTTAFLSSVLALAASDAQATALKGMGLLSVYALGMMIPFITCMALWTRLSSAVRWLKQHQGLIRKCGGVLMILLGAAKLFGLF
ncbi:MAG: cytochrome c biogenesis protein CcdA [Clostridia bacterium]|nr:cytochrome c biogenesis protein CcdA [Clostridia bacterium]